MKLYAYANDNGKIKQEEIEVEEKVVLVPVNNSRFPFSYDSQLDKNKIGKLVGFNKVVFFKQPNFKGAKEMFIENARKTLSQNKGLHENSMAVLLSLEREEDSKGIECERGDK